MDARADMYLEEEVAAADPARLVELLYRRAIGDLEGAAELWTKPDSAPIAIRRVVHAQAILTELSLSLNYEGGGELAGHLGRLYEYFQFLLTQAVADQPSDGPKNIAEVLELLTSLSDAWSKMRAQQTGVPSRQELVTRGSLVA